MRVIAKSRLNQFWERPGRLDSRGSLLAWYQRVNNRSVDWKNWADLKRDYSTASPVGNCVVFNIAGNNYRLITRVLYSSHKVFILRVLSHTEYDQDTWKHECGCLSPSPTRKRQPRRPAR